MKEVNVGILGFGFMGKVSTYGYINLPLFYDPVPVKARLHSICDSATEITEKARALFNFDRACADFKEITEDPAIDVVHICTPNKFHKDALLSAMANGKHIYCEKPLVSDAAEAEEIERALRDYHGTAQVAFNTRFIPATIRAKELVEEGFLGRILSFRVAYLHSGSTDPKAPLKWKLSRQMGGGVIADLGSHVLDIANHLVGDFDAIWCATHIAYPDRPAANDSGRQMVEAEDSAIMAVRLPDGCVGTLEATKLATGSQDELRFEIHGERGAIQFNSMRLNWLGVYDLGQPKGDTGGLQGWLSVDTVQQYPKPASGFPSPKMSIGWLRSNVACLHNFLQSVACDEPSQPGLEQGIYVQRVMEAAKVSTREGRWVDLKETSKRRLK